MEHTHLERTLPLRPSWLLYRITTAIIVLLMSVSALKFAFDPELREGFRHLGLPNWFRIELTAAKLVGSLALILPSVPDKVREFAYFGFGLTIVSADIAHLASGDSPWYLVPHALLLGILVVSYRQFLALRAVSGRV